MKPDEQRIGRGGITLSMLFMRLMFRSVQGWKQDVPAGVHSFVEIARDGSQLEGATLTCRAKAAKGVVLLCHPFLKYGMHYFLEHGFDRELRAHGYHVVIFNFKGFGRSNINGHAFSDDVLSIAARITREYPDLPLHLLGCSFGGYHLSHALARDPSAFSSAVLDSVPISVRNYFTRGVLKLAMRWISGSALARPTGTCAIVDSLDQLHGLPIAYLYGEQDKYIPSNAASQLAKVCGSMEFFSFDDCRHLEAHKKHRERYFRIVLDFFARAAGREDIATMSR